MASLLALVLRICTNICSVSSKEILAWHALYLNYTKRSKLTHTRMSKSTNIYYIYIDIYSTYTIQGINHNFLAIKTKPQRFAALLKLMMKQERRVLCPSPLPFNKNLNGQRVW